MRRSAERILTTHAGSLARPDDLRDMLAARDERRPYDAAALGARVRVAVADEVRQQAAIGLDIVNDGELSFEALVEGARLATQRLWPA